MRPAWLPAQPSAVAPSARDTRPRSAASAPSNSPPRDAMVLSARQLLHEPAPHTPPPPQAEIDAVVSLRDFMDSFPLVPLAIIPRLALADLIECERGLVSLSKSLAIDTNPEDAQLGKYIARQLGLVQRHTEEARARERVLKLLRGDEPAELAAIVSVQPSSSSKTLPVFLQPTSPAARTTNKNASPASTQTPVALAATRSVSSLPTRKSDPLQNQLSKAKALAKATVTTAFVITTSENSLKARHKRAKKKTKEQIEEQNAKRQEREKEKRRQAAYQRLMARQALQASKKEEQALKKRKRDVARQPVSPRGSFIAVTSTESAAQQHANQAASSESSSDESDVSNCSDHDAENEKAILDMPVVIKMDEDEPEPQNQGGSDPIPLSNDPDDDGEGDSDEKEGDAHEEDPRIENEDGHTVSKVDEEVRGDPRQDGNSELDETSDDNPADSSSDTEQDAVNVAAEIQVNAPEIGEFPVDEAVESAEAEELRAREAIAMQLHQFVAERTQLALDQLRARHEVEQQVTASARHLQTRSPPRPPTALRDQEPQNDCAEAIVGKTEPFPRPSSASHSHTRTIQPSPTKKRPLPNSSKKMSSGPVSTTALLVPRPLGRDVPDYRSYFANFFCILTSVYEQRVAFMNCSSTGGGTSTSNSSLLTTANISANAAHAGDQALRLQLKLYQSWATIMNDYATVFGKSIPTPDGFSSASTALASPYTAHYRINSQSRKEVSDIVVTALEKLGDWDEHPSGLGLKTTWNLLWTWSKPNVERKTLLAWQKVNHFQHAKALTRKDCLKKNIGKYQAMGGRLKQAYDIVPASFLLPQEYVAFVQAFQERAKSVAPGKNIWIMKPVALSRGRGISLVNSLSDVVYGEQVVIQEYIANPLLIDGFKFDLRLYVLVTSFNPLEVFFYEDGFVRMCTRAYEDSDLTNLFIHLTNSSIQKENQDAIAANPENPINSAQHDAEAGGTKMTLAYLWKRLEAMGADVATVKNDILTVILKALMCGEDHIPFQVNSFDLYGYDILLDTNFRPWLIEINSSPSMARENDLDYQIKDALIYDTLKLVNPLHFDRAKLVDVIARRFHDAEVDKKRSHANTRHPKEAEAMAARQLNEDLADILRGHVPRTYGEMPDHLGSYTRLAPHTTIHNQLMKLKKSCLRLDRK